MEIKPNPGSELPLVSVCVPCFNGQPYLVDALASIEAQEYSNIEVIISDDGSTDGSMDVAEKFAAESRFPCRILRHIPDSPGGNWNYAAAHARGDFIKFVFQDDIIYPKHIDVMVRAATDKSVGFVFSRRDIISSPETARSDLARSMIMEIKVLHDGFTQLSSMQPGSRLLSDPGLFKGHVNKYGEPSFVLIRRTVFHSIGGFDTSFRQLVDLEMYLRLMEKTSVAFVDMSLGAFRVHDAQLSNLNDKCKRGQLELSLLAHKTLEGELRPSLHPDSIEILKTYASGKKKSWIRTKRLQIKDWLKKLF